MDVVMEDEDEEEEEDEEGGKDDIAHFFAHVSPHPNWIWRSGDEAAAEVVGLWVGSAKKNSVDDILFTIMFFLLVIMEVMSSRKWKKQISNLTKLYCSFEILFSNHLIFLKDFSEKKIQRKKNQAKWQGRVSSFFLFLETIFFLFRVGKLWAATIVGSQLTELKIKRFAEVVRLFWGVIEKIL